MSYYTKGVPTSTVICVSTHTTQAGVLGTDGTGRRRYGSVWPPWFQLCHRLSVGHTNGPFPSLGPWDSWNTRKDELHHLQRPGSWITKPTKQQNAVVRAGHCMLPNHLQHVYICWEDYVHKSCGPWPGQSGQWFQQKLSFPWKQQPPALQGFRLVPQLRLQNGCKGLAAGCRSQPCQTILPFSLCLQRTPFPFCSINIDAFPTTSCKSSWQQGKRKQQAQICCTRSNAPCSRPEERGRGTNSSSSHWHLQRDLVCLQLAPQLSPSLLLLSAHGPVPSFCSKTSWWVSDLLMFCSKLIPMSTVPPICTAGCPSLHGWRGASAGRLTHCIPECKPRNLFSCLHSLDENAAAVPRFAVELPVLLMPTHAYPSTIAPMRTTLGICHLSPDATVIDVELHNQILI